MMIDLKPKILASLRGNTTIASLLGTDSAGRVKVYPETAADDTLFPYITFFEITNFDGQHADDVVISSQIHFQVDIWSQGNTFPIAKEVDKEMKMLGFDRSGTADQFESDTKVYHKILRYRTTIYGEVL